MQTAQRPGRGGIAFDLAKRSPARTAGITLLLAFAGLAEAMGFAGLLPLLQQVSDDTGTGVLGRLGIAVSLPVIVLGIVALLTTYAVLRWFAMVRVGRAVAALGQELRAELIDALAVARWRFFVDARAGAVANAVAVEANRAAGAYGRWCHLLAAILRAAATAAVALLIDWRIATFAAVVGTALIVALRPLIGQSRRAGERLTITMRSLGVRTVDFVRAMKPLRAMGKQGVLQPELQTASSSLARAEVDHIRAIETLIAIREPIAVAALGGGLIFGVTVLGAPLPQLLTSAVLFQRILRHLQAAQLDYQAVAYGESAYRGVQELMTSLRSQREDRSGTLEMPRLASGIEVDQVVFSYPGTDTPVLRGVNLRIPAGSMIALTGVSGSGKTTLLDLVARLLDPDSGHIRVDGVELREIRLADWQRALGYVPQDPLLLHNTIYENVANGAQASKTEVERALRLAGAWEFVAQRPEGVGAEVGEQGQRLSGGQRRRIALARALFGSPRVLILDEPTADLDHATERAICDSLRALHGQVTIIVSTHGGLIEHAADVVYGLANGVIVESRER